VFEGVDVEVRVLVLVAVNCGVLLVVSVTVAVGVLAGADCGGVVGFLLPEQLMMIKLDPTRSEKKPIVRSFIVWLPSRI
jgi:hypothetical protein